MKKVLSLILAVIIIASAIPVAFAADECEHIFYKDSVVSSGDYLTEQYCKCGNCGEVVLVKMADYSGYIMATIKLWSVTESVYTSYDFTETENERIEYISTRFSEIEEEVENYPYVLTDKYQDAADAWAAEITSLANEVASYIKGEKLVDATEFLFFDQILYVYIRSIYTNKEIKEIENKMPEGMDDAAFDARIAGHQYLENARKNPETASQEAFDAVWKDLETYGRALINCLENNHDYSKGTDNLDGTHSLCCYFCGFDAETTGAHVWGEYVSNGDGTETAKCTYCEATDTKVEEKTEADEEIADNIFQLIKIFIDMIIDFFESIFK